MILNLISLGSKVIITLIQSDVTFKTMRYHLESKNINLIKIKKVAWLSFYGQPF